MEIDHHRGLTVDHTVLEVRSILDVEGRGASAGGRYRPGRAGHSCQAAGKVLWGL